MNKLLIIVDPQNDFIWGSLQVSGASETMHQLALYLTSEVEYNQVVITADMHPDNHCSFVEYGGQWPAHCVRHTDGCKINGKVGGVVKYLYEDRYLILDKGLDPDHEEYSILKNATSMKRLLPYLLEADEIHICGIAGDFCVLETIKDLVKLHFTDKLVVLKKYVASTDDGKALDEYIKEHSIKCL